MAWRFSEQAVSRPRLERVRFEVSPEVELEQGGRVVGAAAFGGIGADLEAAGGEIELVDEGIDGAHGTGRGDVVVDGCGQQHGLVPVAPFEIQRHAEKPAVGIRKRKNFVFRQSLKLELRRLLGGAEYLHRAAGAN